ncbi:hypothetical protein NBRC111894_1049 [Sporolactobacillus inulinus]|uniref:Uncharacterized protein n=1 Tax=Sporolactobacillus inulinus TaxID=2078 RepID=A0A4Y1Z919_9BACL|nr:hypothetical protein NBRC111894_1049 [Sporolactobacillus inulinus]
MLNEKESKLRARRLREQRASETPQISVCLRRLAVRPRQASNRSGDSAPKRHESIASCGSKD